MNVAFFMQPKQDTAFIYSDYTVRQTLEKMHHHGYSAIPVLDRDGRYAGTVSEGDLLWFIVTGEGDTPHTADVSDLERYHLSDLMLPPDRNPAIRITSPIDELIMRALNQNFIPVVDDRDLFIGIVTRRSVIKYFYDKNDLPAGD